jgi:hypothetical protein
MVSRFVDHLSVNIRKLADEVDASGGVTIKESGKLHHVMASRYISSHSQC